MAILNENIISQTGPANHHSQHQPNNAATSQDTKPPTSTKADAMKSRIESFINNGEEDAELADQYLDKRKAIKQQRSVTKTSIGNFFFTKLLFTSSI